MSTRASIIVKDSHTKLFFYRHSDGYPEGIMPTLEKFLQYVKDGRIRDNADQAAGWLIIIGAQEYNTPCDWSEPHVSQNDVDNLRLNNYEPGHDIAINGWKVGAYEPTTGVHGDEEYQYTVDLETKTISVSQDF